MSLNRDLSIIAQNSGGHAASLTALWANAQVQDLSKEDIADAFEFFQDRVTQGVVGLAAESTVVSAANAVKQAFPGAEEVKYEDMPRPTPSGSGRPYENERPARGKYQDKTLGQLFDAGGRERGWVEWVTTTDMEPTSWQARKFLESQGVNV